MNILVETADGSKTIFNEEIGEHYHSAHGALNESRHVFIEAGLQYVRRHSLSNEINILEVGFGTGLNFLLSFAETEEHKHRLNYVGIEAYPLPSHMINSTGYNQYVPSHIWEIFTNTYENSLHKPQILTPNTRLHILHTELAAVKTETKFDLIYFDAFSVRHQPEMWSDEIIAHTCSFLKTGGIFVSYAITGNLKRALKSCGLQIEKLPGAAGKREMIRAKKI